MRFILNFVQDEQSQGITGLTLLVGCLAMIAVIALADLGNGLHGVWNTGSAYFAVSNTLG